MKFTFLHAYQRFLRSSNLFYRSLFCFFVLMSVAKFAKSQTPSTDINKYVLFAYEELHFKGRNGGDMTRGVIQGGNVGVNSCAIPNTKNLTFGAPVKMPTNGTQVVGYDVRIEPGSDIWELYANFVQTAYDPAVLRHGPFHNYACPLIAPSGLPSFPSIFPGAADVTVEKEASLTLAPGNYANLRVKDNGVLTLQSGVYHFNDMSMGKNVRIITTDNTEVRSANDMTFNNDCYVGPSNLAQFYIRSDNTSSNDATIAYGRKTEFHGQVFAPNGRINLGHSTDLYGRFWAKKMSSDFNVSVYYSAPDTGGPEKRQSISPAGAETSSRKTGLMHIFPNPVRNTAIISYTLSQNETVTMKVYNVSGEEVTTLVNDEKGAGDHIVQWNAYNQQAGIYVVRMSAGAYMGTQKIVVIK